MSKKKTMPMLTAMILSVIMAANMMPASALAAHEPEKDILAPAEGNTTQIPSGAETTVEVKGSGTQEDPLQIETAEQLAAYAYAVNNIRLPEELPESPFLILINDIDLSNYGEEYSGGKGWVPIGRFDYDYYYDYDYDLPKDLYAFKGTFDGNGKKISNLYINRADMGEVGLFGYVNNGTIKNLTVEDGSVTGWFDVGGIVGWLENGAIDNCSFSGSVTGVSTFDEEYGEWYSDDIGGIAGRIDMPRIENCENTGSVSGDDVSCNVGGIAGSLNLYQGDESSDYFIRNCSNNGNVTGGSYVGGIAGNSSASTEGCLNTGLVHGVCADIGSSFYVGGIAGFQGNDMISCVNTGDVTGEADMVGGLTGDLVFGTMQNCYNSGKVSAVGGNVGGLVGEAAVESTIQSCVNAGPVSGGANNIGGLAGSLKASTIQNCINYADVSVNESAIAINVAGVAGLIQNGSTLESGQKGCTVTNCLTTGTVSGKVTGEVMVGGICGIVGFIDGDGYYGDNEAFSTLSCCVALGQSVNKSGGCGNVGRVAVRDESYYEQNTYLSFAWTDMEVYWDDPIPKEYFGIYTDGYDADAAILYKLWSDTEPYTEPDWYAEPDQETIVRYFAGLFAESWRDAGVWTLADGKLPVLTDMPEGTVQYEDFPDYISGVAGVTVSPGTASVKKGSTKAFTATVEGINIDGDTVTWSVSGANHEGTTIDASGVLTVAEEETAKSLTVTAVSDGDSSKSGTATVTVTSDVSPYVPGPSGGSPASSTGSSATVTTGGGTTETVRVITSGGSSSAELTSGLGSQLAGGQSITISFPEADDVTDYSLSLPAAGLTSEGGGELTIVTGVGSVSLPSDMLTGIAASSEGIASFSISGADVAQLPEDVREAVGTRPVISLSVSLDGEPIRWNNLGAPVTVSIPYIPSNGEDPNAIVVWYIDSDGNLNCITNGRYDAESGTVSFETTHFSHYAVGYNKVSFADVPDNSWYFDAISYLSAREITNGTSSDTFSPDANLTRGQFITLLLRAYGIDADDASADNFADAGGTYYTGYLAAAKRLGISDGVGDNKFAPEQFITRQEMSTLLYRSLNILDKLPKASSGKGLESFSDSGDIEPYALDAMDYLVKAGAINGSDNMLAPRAFTTRAQMAQLLYNLLSK
jgi:hypothetical protein